jgi:hypothetical protein
MRHLARTSFSPSATCSARSASRRSMARRSSWSISASELGRCRRSFRSAGGLHRRLAGLFENRCVLGLALGCLLRLLCFLGSTLLVSRDLGMGFVDQDLLLFVGDAELGEDLGEGSES